MARHKSGPVGLGYLPKGGKAAGQARNAAWAVEQEAALRDRPATPSRSESLAATTDGVQVRASAPGATVGGAPALGLLGIVERGCYAGAGAVTGMLFVLAVLR